jgi:hypothetical protein
MGQKFKVLCLCDFAKFPIYASLLFLYCTVEITQHLCHRSVLDSEWDGDMKGLSQTGALANSSIDAGVSLLQTMQSSVWSQCLFSLHLWNGPHLLCCPTKCVSRRVLTTKSAPKVSLNEKVRISNKEYESWVYNALKKRYLENTPWISKFSLGSSVKEEEIVALNSWAHFYNRNEVCQMSGKNMAAFKFSFLLSSFFHSFFPMLFLLSLFLFWEFCQFPVRLFSYQVVMWPGLAMTPSFQVIANEGGGNIAV